MGGHRMVPSADEHFYCATKYAVTALTEGIRQELREANTRIRATVSWLLMFTAVCAGSLPYAIAHILDHKQYFLPLP